MTAKAEILCAPRILDSRTIVAGIDNTRAKATVLHLALAGLQRRSFLEAELAALEDAAKTIEDELESLASEVHG